MNTLDDLRHTLDVHARDVHDDTGRARVAAVRGRAVGVRRRRTAGVGAATGLAVVAALVVPQLFGDAGVDPAAAPESRTALGWTYRLDETARSASGEVRVRLPASDLPRLVSWSTEGSDQRVDVRTGGSGSLTSSAADFTDHLQLPPGYRGTVRVTGAAGLSLATYTLDTSVWPEGVGSGPGTFRDEVAGYDFLGATVGEPGQASIEVDLVPSESLTWIGYSCENMPAGTRMNVNWVGAEGAVSSGGCDSSVDPGGSPGTGLLTGRRAGEAQTLRLWLTRNDRPVADGEFPELRLGLGAYAASGTPTEVAGIEMREALESQGHVWRLVDVVTAEDGESPRVEVPSEGQFLVRDAVQSTTRARVAVTVDGRAVQGDTIFAGGGAGGGERIVPAGSVVSLDFGRTRENVRRAGLALYERVD